MQFTVSVNLPESTTTITYNLENIMNPSSMALQSYIKQLNCNPIMYSLSVVKAVNTSKTEEQSVHFIFPNSIELLFVEVDNATFFSVFPTSESETTFTKMLTEPFDTDIVYDWCDYFFKATVQAAYISGYIK